MTVNDRLLGASALTPAAHGGGPLSPRGDRWSARIRFDTPDEGGGGGGGDGDALDPKDPRVVAIVEAAKKGVDNKNRELLATIAELKPLKEMIAELGGVDGVKKLQTFSSQIAENEELKLIQDGKFDEVIARRTERMAAKHQKDLDALTAQNQTLTTERDAIQKRLASTVIDLRVRATASEAKVLPEFHDDVALWAGQTFNGLSEDGRPLALGEDGEPVTGSDGKSPLTPAEWLDSMKDKKPGWWPSSNPSGGAGGRGNGPAGTDLTVLANDPAAYRAARQKQIKQQNGG